MTLRYRLAMRRKKKTLIGTGLCRMRLDRFIHYLKEDCKTSSSYVLLSDEIARAFGLL